MTMTLLERLLSMFLYAPEGEGAGGGGGAGEGGNAPAAPADPGSVLFPNDKPQESGGSAPAGSEGGDKSDDPKASDWKEYQPDPNKSDEENARLKAEHDKTKPKGDDKEKSAADQVPADGKYDLKMPDGVEVDTELLAAIAPQFKEAGLTQGQAQKLADAYAKIIQDRATKANESWAETVSKWVDDAKADKDIGGDKWDATVAAAQRAVDKLGTPALKEYLNASGGGNHPELIRFMSKVGALVREDNPASGGVGSGKPADPAHILFPGDAPKGI
jgi:hypothetical protein